MNPNADKFNVKSHIIKLWPEEIEFPFKCLTAEHCPFQFFFKNPQKIKFKNIVHMFYKHCSRIRASLVIFLKQKLLFRLFVAPIIINRRMRQLALKTDYFKHCHDKLVSAEISNFHQVIALFPRLYYIVL